MTIIGEFGRSFRGFYLQARLANDTGLEFDEKLRLLSDRALGQFILFPQGTKLHSCNEGNDVSLNNSTSCAYANESRKFKRGICYGGPS